ncbi:TetR/AcrR family transcriptional regulator [Ilumatobacter coccineus]|nr:TetR/AcrR family transcriptional regulator [Ilumatobacter coccineus]
MRTSGTSDKPRSPWIADLRWARETQQDRSKQTQAALLDAVEAELGTSTIDALSVNAIAERAGVSVGSVYFHFTNKQALIHAMVDRFVAEWIVTTDDATDPERWVGASFLDVLRGFAEFSLRGMRQAEGVTKARLQLALVDPEIAAQEEKGAMHMVDRVFDLLWARRSEIGRPDPGAGIGYVIDQTIAMTRLRASVPGTRIATDTDATFIDATIESAQAFLQIDARR